MLVLFFWLKFLQARNLLPRDVSFFPQGTVLGSDRHLVKRTTQQIKRCYPTCIVFPRYTCCPQNLVNVDFLSVEKKGRQILHLQSTPPIVHNNLTA